MRACARMHQAARQQVPQVARDCRIAQARQGADVTGHLGQCGRALARGGEEEREQERGGTSTDQWRREPC